MGLGGWGGGVGWVGGGDSKRPHRHSRASNETLYYDHIDTPEAGHRRKPGNYAPKREGVAAALKTGKHLTRYKLWEKGRFRPVKRNAELTLPH